MKELLTIEENCKVAKNTPKRTRAQIKKKFFT